MRDLDWYAAFRRSAIVAFILLTAFAVVQATSLYTIWYGMDTSLTQLSFIMLWPFSHAPIWFKCVYFPLAFFLFVIYLWPVDSL